MTTALITGFDPFAGDDHNPSWDVAEELAARAGDGRLIAQAEHPDLTVHARRLPVVHGTALETLDAAIAAVAPDVVVSLGLAGGTEAVRLERVGLNLRDARIPDNAGAQPVDEPIVDDGEPALFSTLRLKAAHTRIAAAGIPVQLSLSAGSFVCNEVLYGLVHRLRERRQDARPTAHDGDSAPSSVRGGFVHVPSLRAADSPVSLEQAVEAVDLLLAESLHDRPDAEHPGGALH
ncbi:pyrrolidone-carboxylate peptidase [Nesterenkonia sp. F]|uniref:pyroglutamyl-peptidase I family protein n=1 Tax=Nesterenkonia sp. F TaxID=795955 RepID=UPI000255C8D4|nr:pyrrolidone-carboxylate peptidase [Nesterenkonia sp. F]